MPCAANTHHAGDCACASVLRTCSITDCGKPHKAKGFCCQHYNCFRNNGDPLIHRRPELLMSDEERFNSKINREGSVPENRSDLANCWVWTNELRNGYGRFKLQNKTYSAHILTYTEANGPVPEDLDLDHLCRNRACVRPSHLEAVDRRTNVLRGISLFAEKAKRTHCIYGHEFTPENTKVRPTRPTTREYITCDRLKANKRREHLKTAA